MKPLSFSFSRVNEFWSIFTVKQTVILKQCFIPAIRISPFHRENVLIKPFNHVCHTLTILMGGMNFWGHLTSDLMVLLYGCCDQMTVVIISLLFPNIPSITPLRTSQDSFPFPYKTKSKAGSC